jgi:hypothetical protein
MVISNPMDCNVYRNSSIAAFAVQLKNLIDIRKNLSLKRGRRLSQRPVPKSVHFQPGLALLVTKEATP